MGEGLVGGQVLFGEMQAGKERPLILTLRLDADSQAFFDALRAKHFPPERNFLKAHLTLLHQLPDEAVTLAFLNNLQCRSFTLQVTGLMNLGGGVAYRLESPELLALHSLLRTHFKDVLIPQDKQGFRPHIVVQNKVKPETAKKLLAELSAGFSPFVATVTGIDIWRYLGGPWEHVGYNSFS